MKAPSQRTYDHKSREECNMVIVCFTMSCNQSFTESSNSGQWKKAKVSDVEWDNERGQRRRQREERRREEKKVRDAEKERRITGGEMVSMIKSLPRGTKFTLNKPASFHFVIVRCYNCRREGHIGRNCLQRRRRPQRGTLINNFKYYGVVQHQWFLYDTNLNAILIGEKKRENINKQHD